MKTQLVRPSVSDLSSRSGNTILLSWESTPTLTGGRKNPMQGRVTKLSTGTVTLGATGAYAIRKVEEGEFSSSDEVQKRPWGSRIGNTCIIEHKGAMYAEFFYEDKPHSTYFLDNVVIAKDDIIGLPVNTRKDTKVLLSTVKAANIKILTEA